MRRDLGGRIPRSAFRLTAAVAVAVLLAAGCGGGGALSKADYLSKVQGIGDKFTTTITDTFNAPELQDPSNLGQAAGIIRQGADQIRDAAGELEGLSPPADVESTHDKFVNGLKAFAADLDTFADAAASGNIAVLSDMGQKIASESLPSMVQVQAAIDEFKDKGYDVESS